MGPAVDVLLAHSSKSFFIIFLGQRTGLNHRQFGHLWNTSELSNHALLQRYVEADGTSTHTSLDTPYRRLYRCIVARGC